MVRAAEEKIVRIGYLSARFGVCPETVRVWERQGLIPVADRTPGGHRRYGRAHVDAMSRLITPMFDDADFDEVEDALDDW